MISARIPALIELGDLSNYSGVVIEGNDANDPAGSAMGGSGDFNGDGISDLIIGAEGDNYPDRFGEAFVLLGSKEDSIFADPFQQ